MKRKRTNVSLVLEVRGTFRQIVNGENDQVNREMGTIIWIDRKNGQGVIVRARGGSIPFHQNDIRLVGKNAYFIGGLRVEYTVHYGQSGLSAKDIIVLE